MNHQNTCRFLETVCKTRQVFAEQVRSVKIVDTGKALICPQAGRAKPGGHFLAKSTDHCGFNPGKFLPPQGFDRKKGVADIRTFVFRQAEKKSDQRFSDSRRLMNVKMSVDVIRWHATL